MEIVLLTATAVVALPYGYLMGRLVGVGYYAAKLDYHRKILAEHRVLGLDQLDEDDNDNEREEEGNGRTYSTS